MNKARRSALADVIKLLEIVNGSLEDLCAEEEEAFDNMPESLQESQRGETMQDTIDYLSDACSSIEDAIDSLNEIE